MLNLPAGRFSTPLPYHRIMVIAHHLILTAYGWWLPNDPRGSSSQTVGRDVIAELGELHRGRRRVQPPSPAIREFYTRAEGVLYRGCLSYSDFCASTARLLTSAVAVDFPEDLQNASAPARPVWFWTTMSICHN